MECRKQGATKDFKSFDCRIALRPNSSKQTSGVPMKVIHFTEGAAEHFESSQVSLTKFIPLLQGTHETYVTCLHYLPEASVVELPTFQ